MAANDSNETSASGAECPSTMFARGLKTYSAHSFTKNDIAVSEIMVITFDEQQFQEKCSLMSPAYTQTLCDFDKIAAELFKKREMWLNRDLLICAVKTLSELHGWSYRINRTCIECNRVGEDVTTRNYAGGGLKGGCTFIIKFSALVVNKEMAVKPNGTKKWKRNPDWDQPVQIIDVCCTHGGACRPGKQNRIDAMQRGGKYIENMPSQVLFLLCNYSEDGRLSSSIIKKLVGPVWPKGKVFSKTDVFNIRVKVNKLMKVLRSTNRDYEEFKKLVSPTDLLKGIDNEVSLDDDEAYELAQQLWAEVMDNISNKDEALFSFIDYLELISTRAKGFVYKLAEDKSADGNGRKKLIGVMWQTATMRRNFELFGDYISLDMMKRGLNKFLWPYAGVSMYDETKHLCIGCEGFLCGERVDMYEFLADFLASSTPNRTLDQVKIVAGDAFFSQEMIQRLGFTSATFVLDRWHLLDSGLKKIFGKSGYAKLERHLVGMVEAESKYVFDSYYKAAQESLQSMDQRNEQLESDLKSFAERRDNYATYAIQSIPGNRGLLGSTSSEQNHSSVVNYLNDGENKNSCCGLTLDNLIKDLIRRAGWHANKTNERLNQCEQKMVVERGRLQREPGTESNRDLLIAVDVLGHHAYARYKEQHVIADNDLDVQHTADALTGARICTVTNTRNPNEEPVIFRSATDRCMCTNRLRDDSMCAHEIKAKNGFVKSCFNPQKPRTPFVPHFDFDA